MFKIVLLLLSTLFLTNSFYTYVDSIPLCLDFYSNEQQQRIQYDVVDHQSENMNITIYDSGNRVIRQFGTARDIATINVTNRFKICFATTDRTQKAVSFDIWQDSANSMKQLATKSELYALHSSIAQASSVLKVVSEQQKFQEYRQTIHTEFIKQTEDILKSYGVIKVVIIVAVILIQIVILKKSTKCN